jgi:hypothetical protein
MCYLAPASVHCACVSKIFWRFDIRLIWSLPCVPCLRRSCYKMALSVSRANGRGILRASRRGFVVSAWKDSMVKPSLVPCLFKAILDILKSSGSSRNPAVGCGPCRGSGDLLDILQSLYWCKTPLRQEPRASLPPGDQHAPIGRAFVPCTGVCRRLGFSHRCAVCD